MSEQHNGNFLWYDLMTTDQEGAAAFYGEVVGFGTDTWGGDKEGMPEYTMLTAGHGPFGGMMDLPEPAKAAGAPPHWIGYVGVSSVDDSVAQVKELGGQVVVPATDIPEIGRFSICLDPHGAAFALYTSVDPGDSKPEETIIWHELATKDIDEALAFYTKLFGWTKGQAMEHDGMTYQMYEREGKALGGMMKVPDPNIPAHWVFYTGVDDIDAGTGRVQSNGGTVLHGPAPIPGDSHITIFKDAQGAVFAILGPKKGN